MFDEACVRLWGGVCPGRYDLASLLLFPMPRLGMCEDTKMLEFEQTPLPTRSFGFLQTPTNSHKLSTWILSKFGSFGLVAKLDKVGQQPVSNDFLDVWQLDLIKPQHKTKKVRKRIG